MNPLESKNNSPSNSNEAPKTFAFLSEEVMQSCRKMGFALLLRGRVPDDQCEDLIQSAFLRMLDVYDSNSLDSANPQRSLRALFKRVLIRLYLDQARRNNTRRKYQETAILLHNPRFFDPEKHYTATEGWSTVSDFLAAKRNNHREIALGFMTGEPDKEIALKTKMSLEGVRSTRSRLRKGLRERLGL